MIRPTRLNIAVGGEHLLPVAKHALLMLRTQMERLKVPTLSRILDVGDGRIEIVANAFGIDAINISYKDALPSGFITWPASDEAPAGWGKPFSNDDGERINPPLGTVLDNPSSPSDKRNVLIRHKYDNSELLYSMKRRLGDVEAGLESWISKDGKIVLSCDGTTVFRKGEVIAKIGTYSSDLPELSAYENRILTFGVYTDEKKYLWVIVSSVDTSGQTKLLSCRTKLTKKIGKVTRFDGKMDFTEWVIINEYPMNEVYFLGYLYPVKFRNAKCNASGSEAAIAYQSSRGPGPDYSYIPYGYLLISRGSPNLDRHDVTGRIGFEQTKNIDGSTSYKNYTESVTAESGGGEFVYDIGYRGDDLVKATLYLDRHSFSTSSNYRSEPYHKSARLDHAQTIRFSCGDLSFVYYKLDLSCETDIVFGRYYSRFSRRTEQREIIYYNPSDNFGVIVERITDQVATASGEEPNGTTIDYSYPTKNSVRYLVVSDDGEEEIFDVEMYSGLPPIVEGSTARQYYKDSLPRWLDRVDPDTYGLVSYFSINLHEATEAHLRWLVYIYGAGNYDPVFRNGNIHRNEQYPGLNTETVSSTLPLDVVTGDPYSGEANVSWSYRGLLQEVRVLYPPNSGFTTQPDPNRPNYAVCRDKGKSIVFYSIPLYVGYSVEDYESNYSVLEIRVRSFDGSSVLDDDIKVFNHLTGSDPVELTEIVGDRPRFNDIEII